MGDSEHKEPGTATRSEQFEVAGLSRRALLDRMKAAGVGFGAAYMLGIANADAAVPSGGTARIRSKDEAVNAIIEEGEDAAGGRTRVADSGEEEKEEKKNNYSRAYSRGYSRDYSRDYNRDYNRGYSRGDYSRGYSRDYDRGGYSRGYSRGGGGYSRGGGYHGGRYHGGGHHGGGGRGGGGRRGGGRRSDIHSKENVVLLGHLADGLGFYRFNYIAGETTYVGVMAQEVQAVHPEAVVRGPDGYLRVSYDQLGLRMQTFDAWIGEGGKIPTPIH